MSKITKMKNLQTLYPYLTQDDLTKRKGQLVRILIKIRKISESEANQFINNAISKKLNDEMLSDKEREVVNFFNHYKNPIRDLLKQAKNIHHSMPANSGLTIKL